MRPFAIADEDRAAYHAAAAIAANFLTTIEGAAERLAATAAVPREALVPLVRAAVDNWAALGARAALTGPIVRGDEAVVDRQRAARGGRPPAPARRGGRPRARARRPVRRACHRHTRPRRRAGMRTVRTVSELRAALAE